MRWHLKLDVLPRVTGTLLPQILHIGSSKLAGSPFSLGWKPKCSQTGDVTLGFGMRAPAIVSAFKINETPDTNSSRENDTRNTLVSLLIYLTFNAQWWIVKQEGHSLMKKIKNKKYKINCGCCGFCGCFPSSAVGLSIARYYNIAVIATALSVSDLDHYFCSNSHLLCINIF